MYKVILWGDRMYKVSVIVTIYNSEENLNKCLDSIRNQTYKNLEIILLDKGSTDNSLEIAKGYARFDPRVKLFNVDKLDTYDAINYATDNATGQYILYVDSRDTWLDTRAISLMVENQEKYSSDAIQVDSYDIYRGHQSYDDRYNDEDGEGLILDNKYLMEELEKNERVKNNIWGKLYKTDLIKEMLVTKQMKVEETRWLHNVMTLMERYIILHKPMIYYVKEV